MKRLSTALSPLLFLALACSMGCSESPNLLTLTREGIRGQGSISSKGEQVESIDIYPAMLSSVQSQDLWIGFSSDKQVRLQSISEDLLKSVATPASHYYPAYYVNHHNHDFYIDAYNFQFENRQVKELSVNLYGWPPKNITAFVNIGSSNGASLKLPCSVSDFEKVFGKVKIGRTHYE